MKKIFGFIAFVALALAGCNNDDDTTWNDYKSWRETNAAWIQSFQKKTNADGTPYYQQIVPSWNPASFILIHYFNDRKETEGNLSPLYTSTVSTRYELRIYPDSLMDQSYNASLNPGGLFTTTVNGVVDGFSAALMDMRCGDTCEIIVPYILGYGTTGGNVPPYTALHFNMRLHDIIDYEKAPY